MCVQCASNKQHPPMQSLERGEAKREGGDDDPPHATGKTTEDPPQHGRGGAKRDRRPAEAKRGATLAVTGSNK